MDSGSHELTRIVVHQWQCDHFGHMNVRHYAAIFDDAIFVFWNEHRSTADDRIVPVTAEIRIGFRSEVLAGTIAKVRSRVERLGSKSVTLLLEMADARSDQLLATCEVVEVFFNAQSRQSEQIPEPIRKSLTHAG